MDHTIRQDTMARVSKLKLHSMQKLKENKKIKTKCAVVECEFQCTKLHNQWPNVLFVMRKFCCECKVRFFFLFFLFHLQLTPHSANWKSAKLVHGLDVAINRHNLWLLPVAVHSGVGNINTVTQNVLVLHHFSNLLQSTWFSSTLLITTASVSVICWSRYSSFIHHFLIVSMSLTLLLLFLLFSYLCRAPQKLQIPLNQVYAPDQRS